MYILLVMSTHKQSVKQFGFVEPIKSHFLKEKWVPMFSYIANLEFFGQAFFFQWQMFSSRPPTSVKYISVSKQSAKRKDVFG